jgi:tellurite resistance protein TerC
MHSNQVSFINGGKPVEWAPDIGTWTSLIVIVVTMSLATAASLIKLKVDTNRTARSR